MSNAREAILARVRAALENPSHLPAAPDGVDNRIEQGLAAAAPKDHQGLALQFKKEVETVSGECYILSSVHAAAEKLADLLRLAPPAGIALDGDPVSRAAAEKLHEFPIFDAAELSPSERRSRLAMTPAGLVTADFGIADTGTVILQFDAARSGWAHVLPETIFTLLPADRLLPNLHAFTRQADRERAKKMVLITGPSRTADIEKILILGAHGPRRLVVLIC
jgi:L-lactate dehydrogenase complex protein LldG